MRCPLYYWAFEHLARSWWLWCGRSLKHVAQLVEACHWRKVFELSQAMHYSLPTNSVRAWGPKYEPLAYNWAMNHPPLQTPTCWSISPQIIFITLPWYWCLSQQKESNSNILPLSLYAQRFSDQISSQMLSPQRAMCWLIKLNCDQSLHSLTVYSFNSMALANVKWSDPLRQDNKAADLVCHGYHYGLRGQCNLCI